MNLLSIRNEALRQQAQYENEQAIKKLLDWLNQGNNMGKIIMHDRDLERTQDLTIGQHKRIEIVYDEIAPDKIELYYLDTMGTRLEGGTFDLNSFMDAVEKFYNENF